MQPRTARLLFKVPAEPLPGSRRKRFDKYVVEVISDPHSLQGHRKASIVTQLQDVTFRGFGGQRQPTLEEITERTVDPRVSVLVLVHKVTGKKRKLMGYFSTHEFAGEGMDDTIHLRASVLHPEVQSKGFYSMLKRIALASTDLKMRLKGRHPKWVTALTQDPFVLQTLRGLGIRPVHLHPNSTTPTRSGFSGPLAAVQHQALAVQEALGGYHGLDPTRHGFDLATSIRRGAFPFKAGEDPDPNHVKDPAVWPLFFQGLDPQVRPIDANNGDAVFAIGKHVPTSWRMVLNPDLVQGQRRRGAVAQLYHRLRRADSDLYERISNNPQHHILPVIAELLLGESRDHVQDIKIDASHRVPQVTLLLKKGRINALNYLIDMHDAAPDKPPEREELRALERHAFFRFKLDEKGIRLLQTIRRNLRRTS